MIMTKNIYCEKGPIKPDSKHLVNCRSNAHCLCYARVTNVHHEALYLYQHPHVLAILLKDYTALVNFCCWTVKQIVLS